MRDVFDSIKLGLQEAIDHASGKEIGVRAHRPDSLELDFEPVIIQVEKGTSD